jgi:2-(1,2-epoxy-1,2-dihydrophenyl)acetyl-CoA isomerase
VPLGQLPQPIIVAARGWAVGAGFEFCAMADLVVASETARFSMPLVNLGHTADHGESFYLPRKVGVARASQIALLGETLSAADAERYGLVNWVVADAALDDKVAEVAHKLANGAYTAVVGMKALLRDSLQHTMLEQFEMERIEARKCVATDDFVEAIKAFNERRRPVFKGK